MNNYKYYFVYEVYSTDKETKAAYNIMIGTRVLDFKKKMVANNFTSSIDSARNFILNELFPDEKDREGKTVIITNYILIPQK